MAEGPATLQEIRSEAVQAAEAGEFAKAAELFRAAVQLCPTDGCLHEQLAQCLMELEQHDEALSAAQEATVVHPTWPDAWVTLARCYLNTGQLEPAQAAFTRSLALEPDQPDVRDELSEVMQLAQQEISRRVGLPGLKITADLDGQLGPGCVVWEAGIVLAQYLVSHAATNKHQHQHTQHSIAATSAVQPVDSLVDSHAAAEALPSAPRPIHSKQHHPPPVAGATVLEVGSGTGIVGITAAASGAQVTLTDLPELQPLLTTNIAANQQLVVAAGGSAAAAVLDWEHIGMLDVTEESGGCDQQQVMKRRYDWAMGADLIFNKQQVAPVVCLIAALLGKRPDASSSNSYNSSSGHVAQAVSGQQVPVPVVEGFLMSHKHRHEHVDQLLLSELSKAGLNIQLIAAAGQQQQPKQQVCQHQHEDVQAQPGSQQSISIWWLTRS